MSSAGNDRTSRPQRRTPLTLFQPVRTRRTVENVVTQIAEHIKDGELEEGDALPGERQLAARMEVSRRTIRQAVSVLPEAGVLTVLPGPAGGIRVRSIWLSPHLGEQVPPLSADEVIEVLEARRTIEPRVAQLAAMRATDADFAAMRSAIDIHRNVSDDREKLNQANTLFHRVMWRSARNSALEAAMRSIWDSLEVALDTTSRTDTDQEDSLRLHEETLVALRKGKPAVVEAAMDAHLRYLEDICEDVLGRDLHRPAPVFLRPAGQRKRSA